jgi:hypothetical protein
MPRAATVPSAISDLRNMQISFVRGYALYVTKERRFARPILGGYP